MSEKSNFKNGHGSSGLSLEEPTLFEQSIKGRRGISLEKTGLKKTDLGKSLGALLRESPAELPELAEVDIVRHFTRLSIQNYSKDLGFYPLGSCTMKHNPRVANAAAAIEAFQNTHPYQRDENVQGNLKLCHELETMLAEISGMDSVTLWPAAGSHGELTGMLLIRAYHTSNGNPRSKVLIPDSAHGTNPASAAICHYEVVTVKSGADGLLDPDAVRAAMDDEVAAIMITNPNTLGLNDGNIEKITRMVHDCGGLCYYDGANLNAILMHARPGDMGFDCVHWNVHKTLSTPHGG
ncbi:MAG TPA: aminomethyl-transferring glycine dehydrogenase subunit GcvPB, partial [bacterium]|nr:aminomethyl-transferring glycine dehydrogenase subunit GcvPB [bacterium]